MYSSAILNVMTLHKGLVPIIFSFRTETCWISLVNLGEDKSVADREKAG